MTGMEIEVKLRLLSRQDYDKAERLLETTCGKPFKVQKQRNVFFDGVNESLSKTKSVMRLRVINNEKYILTLKGNANLQNGISRVEETEEEVPVEVAKRILTDPNEISNLSKTSPLIKRIVETYPSDKWRIMGQFENLRKKFKWESYVVELDETTFSFGLAYEIELETAEPELAKSKLENLLNEHGVSFTNSGRNKFVNMLKGSVL